MVKFCLVLLGSGGVGKTSLIDQFINGMFDGEYQPTVAESYNHSVQVTDGIFQTVEILDTAGMHQFPAMRELSIKSGQAFLIVYSVNSQESFSEALQLRELVISIKGTTEVPVVLVGNKRDCDSEREVEEKYARNRAEELNCLHLETSARYNHNVDLVFIKAFNKIYNKHIPPLVSHKSGKKLEKSSSALVLPVIKKGVLRRNSDRSKNNSNAASCVLL